MAYTPWDILKSKNVILQIAYNAFIVKRRQSQFYTTDDKSTQ